MSAISQPVNTTPINKEPNRPTFKDIPTEIFYQILCHATHGLKNDEAFYLLKNFRTLNKFCRSIVDLSHPEYMLRSALSKPILVDPKMPLGNAHQSVVEFNEKKIVYKRTYLNGTSKFFEIQLSSPSSRAKFVELESYSRTEQPEQSTTSDNSLFLLPSDYEIVKTDTGLDIARKKAVSTKPIPKYSINTLAKKEVSLATLYEDLPHSLFSLNGDFLFIKNGEERFLIDLHSGKDFFPHFKQFLSGQENGITNIYIQTYSGQIFVWVELDHNYEYFEYHSTSSKVFDLNKKIKLGSAKEGEAEQKPVSASVDKQFPVNIRTRPTPHEKPKGSGVCRVFSHITALAGGTLIFLSAIALIASIIIPYAATFTFYGLVLPQASLLVAPAASGALLLALSIILKVAYQRSLRAKKL